MSNIYYSPEDFGMETIGQVEWADESYQFELTVVWRRLSDGAFVHGDDSGCSCPSPFEDFNPAALVALRKRGGLADFKKYATERNDDRGEYRADASVQIAELLERMHKAGAR